MPLTANEEALIGEPSGNDIDHDHQRLINVPEEDSKIGAWSLAALILNRTIGSGIFLTPHLILAGTGCVGGALFVWALGSLISFCGLYVWLECGLSMPQRRVRDEAEPRGVPSSGGEKNYLEFMFASAGARLPHIRTTCSFAIMYLLMYQLSGNAIAFGTQVLIASGSYSRDQIPPRAPVLGIAIGMLTGIVFLHTLSRKGGILINNLFAAVKVVMLVVVFLLGVIKACGGFGGDGQVARDNFTVRVWDTQRRDVSSWSGSILLAQYTFSGWEQPFYVLAEAKKPRKNFPRYTAWALLGASVLFMLVNISYLLVVDKNLILPDTPHTLPGTTDMATLFFERVFEKQPQRAAKAMASIVAFSTFSNLWVMTLTASRIKQEIAKEGILPWSLYIAASYKTPFALLKNLMSHRKISDEAIERAPALAFCLHWLSSVLLVAVVAPIKDTRKSYSILVNLYGYTIIVLVGCWVSTGLVLIKLRNAKWRWQQRRRYRPWLSPVHAVLYSLVTGFILIAEFLPSSKGSPFERSYSGVPHYLVPTIGITAPVWGLLYYLGLLIYGWFVNRRLDVERRAYWTRDPHCQTEYIQVAEIIDHRWKIILDNGMSDDFTFLGSRAADRKDSFVMQQRHHANHDEDDNGILDRQRSRMTRPWRKKTKDDGRFADSFDL